MAALQSKRSSLENPTGKIYFFGSRYARAFAPTDLLISLREEKSTGETEIWLGMRSNLSANVPVEIHGLYSTIKMISAFVLPSEKTV